MSAATQTTVLVSGATGFLALWVVDTLLASGYAVVGTARSEAKYTPFLKEFKAKYPDCKLSYEIVEDVGAPGAFDKALENHPEVTKVIHTASPFSFGLENKDLIDAYIRPAVEGTKNVLKAIKAHAPQVTNLVVTSSYASIMDAKKVAAGHVFTNADWNPITSEQITNEMYAYVASKTFAEKAAWDFVENEKPNFKLATVCPPYIFGPQLFNSGVGKTLNTSNELISKAARVPADSTEYQDYVAGLCVDVRDVAKFHQYGIEKEATFGQRLFIASDRITGQSILNELNNQFPDAGFGKGDASKPFDEKADKFDISNVVDLVGGHEFIHLPQSIKDTVSQYLEVNGSFK